jgi:hypothetical protein
MSSIDHRLSRSSHRLEGRLGQLAEVFDRAAGRCAGDDRCHSIAYPDAFNARLVAPILQIHAPKFSSNKPIDMVLSSGN